MFGRQESRRHKAERIAGQAWDQLAAAVDSAEKSTRTASRRAARRASRRYAQTSGRLNGATVEARRRASAAYSALSGHRPRARWEWLAAASLVGLAAGWAATTVTRRVRYGQRPVELPESLAEEFAR